MAKWNGYWIDEPESKQLEGAKMITWEENLRQRVEADQFGGLEESEKHEILALIESVENYKRIVKVLHDELGEKVDNSDK